MGVSNTQGGVSYTGFNNLAAELAELTSLDSRHSHAIAFDGTYMYFRYPWSATQDCVQRVLIFSSSSTTSGVIDFMSAVLIPIATLDANTITAFAVGTTVSAQGDAHAPQNYNGTFIGGNHGPSIAHLITATGHGKDLSDVGSSWAGPGGRLFYILRVVSSSQLLLVSSSSTPASLSWYASASFYTTSLSGQMLTHNSGAANTSSITITADSITYPLRWISRASISVVADGIDVSPAVVGLVNAPKSLFITEQYSIPNPVAMLAFISGKAGANPSFNDDAIDIDCTVTNVYRFCSNGAIVIDQTVRHERTLSSAYWGVTQENPPVYAGKTLLCYVPGVTPIEQVGTWDLTGLSDFSGTIQALNVDDTTWIKANNPPNRAAYIVSNGGVKELGVVLGYSPVTGKTDRSNRATLSKTAFAWYSAGSKKLYSRAVTTTDGGYLSVAGAEISVKAYRHTYNPALVAGATVASWYNDGDMAIVTLDFHQSVSIAKMALPPEFNGCVCTVIDSSSVNLLSPKITNSEITVECTSTYGYAQIMLVKTL